MAPPLASRFRGQRSYPEKQRCSCASVSDMAVTPTPRTELLPAAAATESREPD